MARNNKAKTNTNSNKDKNNVATKQQKAKSTNKSKSVNNKNDNSNIINDKELNIQKEIENKNEQNISNETSLSSNTDIITNENLKEQQNTQTNIDITQFKDSLDDITHNDEVNTLDFSTPLTAINNSKKQNKHFDRLKTFLNNVYLQSQKQFKVVNLKSNLVKFSTFYVNKNQKRRYVYAILLALIVSVLVIFLVQNSGLYSSGVGGLFQGIARIVQTALAKNELNKGTVDLVYNIIFWGLYLIANIPLLIFSYKKISKEFAYLTAVYICANQIFGFCLNQIPGISDISIFGDTPSASDLPNAPANLNSYLSAIKFARWDGTGTFSLLIYGAVAGVLLGFPYALLYIFGGSTGGTDFVTMYFAIKKNKNIGTLSMIANITCLVFAAIIGSLSSILLADQNLLLDGNVGSKAADKILQAIFCPNFIFSVLMTTLTGIIVNLLFPKMKFIHVKIFTDDANQLKTKLSFSGYKHDIYFDKVENSTLNKESFCMETICMFIELPSLISSIRAIDKKSLIVVNQISSIDGEMFVLK